jgi:hypothetical protein
MNKFDIIIEKWADTIQKDNLRPILKGGWQNKNNTLEIFEFPVKGKELQDAENDKTKDVRMGCNYKGEVYFWDSSVLHMTVAGALNTKWEFRFIYKIGNEFILCVDSRVKDNKALKNCIKTITKSIPRIKFVLENGKLIKVDELLRL